jgi:hypothetical protein
MIERLKENAFLCFTLSLVASYFASFGYYSFFQIDITSFLLIEDLTMIFAKWIWLSGFLVFMTIGTLQYFFQNMENENSWWDKTIGRSLIKRRALIVLPLVLVIIVSAFVYKIVSDTLAAITGIGIVILIIVVLLAAIYSSFKDKKELAEIAFKDWFYLISAIYLFIFIIPFFGGAISANNLNANKVYVKFDEDHFLNTADSLTLNYIGKTSDYFFINNSKTKATTAYSMDKVESFEFIINTK